MLRIGYSYVRFSTPDQLKGDSLRRQLEATARYAKEQGITLDESLKLRDLGVSAFHGKNIREGALAAFIQAIKDKRVKRGSVFIVEHLDRASRDKPIDALELFTSILRAGVSIVTLMPYPHEYSLESVNKNPSELMLAITYMFAAHDFSAKLSERLVGAWIGKRQNIGNRKLTARIPAWLTLSDDKTTFSPRIESAKLVKQIFQWAANGAGMGAITKRLNAANVVNFGNRSKTGWHKSYVVKILKNRAVLGEFQPHTLKDGKRVPTGEPIADYYPAVVSQEMFYQAQAALASRLTQRGPSGRRCANLFTGILFDARDGMPMNLVNKGHKSNGLKLVSSGAMRGRTGSYYRSFPYALVEMALVSAIEQLRESDFADNDQGEQEEDRLAAIEGQLADVEHKILKANRKYDQDGSDVVLDTMTRLGVNRKALLADRERIKAEQSSKKADVVSEAKGLAVQLLTATGNELQTVRERLKGTLRRLIDQIWLRAYGPAGRGYARVQVFYKEGNPSEIIVDERVTFSLFAAMDGTREDLRKHRHTAAARVLGKGYDQADFPAALVEKAERQDFS